MAERRRLDELRIDRSETPDTSPWPRRLLLLGLSVLLVAIAAWWFLAGHAIVVETATVAEAQAGGSAPSVLDASGYVVARRQATVASKVTGRLVEVTVEEGMTVKEGQILARLDDANVRYSLALAEARVTAAEIEVDVNEAFIQRVRRDQPVMAALQAYPEWKIPAHVITTVPAADRQKATVKVRIAFNELGDARILPDMGVKVAFQAEPGADVAARPRLLVPERALRREKDGGIVFVLRGDRVERRAVAVGGSNAGGGEVASGLRAGDTVVLDPPADLADGSRARRR